MRALPSMVMFSPGRNRWMARVAILATAMLIAAACGGAETETTSSDSDTPATENSVASNSADTTGDASDTDVSDTDAATPDASATETSAPETATSDSILVGEYPTMDGQTIDLASLQGSDVVLWFWAPW